MLRFVLRLTARGPLCFDARDPLLEPPREDPPLDDAPARDAPLLLPDGAAEGAFGDERPSPPDEGVIPRLSMPICTGPTAGAGFSCGSRCCESTGVGCLARKERQQRVGKRTSSPDTGHMRAGLRAPLAAGDSSSISSIPSRKPSCSLFVWRWRRLQRAEEHHQLAVGGKERRDKEMGDQTKNKVGAGPT